MLLALPLHAQWTKGLRTVRRAISIPTARHPSARGAAPVLDARAIYPNSSLADLYDDLTMPMGLRRAHQENNKAVLEAYGLPKNTTESAIVAHLFKLYQQLTANPQ